MPDQREGESSVSTCLQYKQEWPFTSGTWCSHARTRVALYKWHKKFLCTNKSGPLQVAQEVPMYECHEHSACVVLPPIPAQVKQLVVGNYTWSRKPVSKQLAALSGEEANKSGP